MHDDKTVKNNENTFNYFFERFQKRSFLEQLHLSGLILIIHNTKKRNEIASQTLGVDTRTIQRWISGAVPHSCAVRLLFNMSMGINQFGSFAGWRCINNELISSTGERVNSDIIGRLWLWRNERIGTQQEISHLKNKIRELEKQSNAHLLDKIQRANVILNEVLELKVVS
jgi:hypothetical protein